MAVQRELDVNYFTDVVMVDLQKFNRGGLDNSYYTGVRSDLSHQQGNH